MKTFVLLLTLALFAAPSVAAQTSFAGTWKTMAGGTNSYTVILNQVGPKVTGSYSPGNGKIFGGVVSGSKLTFNWTQDGGYEGNAEFTMDEDGKGFTGTSNALKPAEFTVTWNTYKSEPASFAGNWETISSGRYSIPLTIVQTGNRVTGLYPGNNGKIEGTVSGKVLRFKWESDGGTGSGRFVMDESNQAFSGTYNSGDDPEEVEATWNGTHAAYKGGKTPPAVSVGKIPPAVSVAGVWIQYDGKWRYKLTLQQAGNQVTGNLRFFLNNSLEDTYYLKEGTLVGNTLRFKAFRIGRERDMSSGEFVRDEDVKSLKGKLGDGGRPFTLILQN